MHIYTHTSLPIYIIYINLYIHLYCCITLSLPFALTLSFSHALTLFIKYIHFLYLYTDNLHNHSTHEKLQIYHEIDNAIKTWGFFQVVNHGISLALLAELKREMILFFKASIEVKKKIKRSKTNSRGFFYCLILLAFSFPFARSFYVFLSLYIYIYTIYFPPPFGLLNTCYFLLFLLLTIK